MLSLLGNRDNSAPEGIATHEFRPFDASRLSHLSAIDIFQDLSEAQIDSLMKGVPMRTADKGTEFYRADDGPKALFLLKSGKVELYRKSADGKRLTMAILESGTFFGEMSLVGQRYLDTSAVALEDCVVCPLSRPDLEALVMEHPYVGLRLIEVIARRLRDSREELQEMAFNDLTGRVAGLLLRLVEDEAEVVEGYSHQDLAAMVGCLRESLTTILDRFKDSNAITIGRKRIAIRDRAQLESVVSQRSGGSPWSPRVAGPSGANTSTRPPPPPRPAAPRSGRYP